MSEKRFKSTIDEDTMSIMPFLVSDNEEEAFYNLQGCVDLLNEQQATIQELERKLKKYAKIGEEQLKQIIELQEENEQLRHELDSLTGCYCADNKEFKDYWRIGYND